MSLLKQDHKDEVDVQEYYKKATQLYTKTL